MMSAHALINAEELRRQNNAAKLRRERLMRGRVPPVASIGIEDYSAHFGDFILSKFRELKIGEAKQKDPIRVKIGRQLDAHVDAYRLYLVLLHEGLNPRVTVAEIIKAVCAFYRVPAVELISPRRTAPVVRARHIAMYLAKTLTSRSLPEIGRRFGGRDHSTIHHAVKKVSRLIEEGDDAADEIKALIAIFGGAA
ncbi:helix-turn-helix domain-containing protein [Xanthobacter lutulentifluminis]|uniref:helix-turn-helix domain-containing protein n=1 Tax=Xanthobacter lutulentifluminis TaxID=3119935 RepID=UPI003735E8B5